MTPDFQTTSCQYLYLISDCIQCGQYAVSTCVSSGLFLFATLLGRSNLFWPERFDNSGEPYSTFFGSYLSVHCLRDDFIATEDCAFFVDNGILVSSSSFVHLTKEFEERIENGQKMGRFRVIASGDFTGARSIQCSLMISYLS